MRVKTNELSGAALDWAVAKCEGYAPINHTILATVWVERLNARGVMDPCPISSLRYSTDWARGGPIIEREGISVQMFDGSSPPERLWNAYLDSPPFRADEEINGPTPLIASMRCYVGSRLGAEIEIPQELQEVGS